MLSGCCTGVRMNPLSVDVWIGIMPRADKAWSQFLLRKCNARTVPPYEVFPLTFCYKSLSVCFAPGFRLHDEAEGGWNSPEIAPCQIS